MKIEQIYTSCLAQGAYYIESRGEVAVIDPLREVDIYIEKANNDKARIKYIFETHFHADFVSGHVSLADKTGATIVYGPDANPSFPAYIAQDNQIFELGKLKIKILHTPGHTLESTVYLLKDENDKDHAIFTGDTLFLGDVGRPDLAVKSHITQEELASKLYRSLRTKIMPLADDLFVYPAHGSGSACGKNMMKETVDTLGNQKKVNYALRANMTENEFIEEVINDLTQPPDYFASNIKLNKEGYPAIDKVLEKSVKPLSPEDFKIYKQNFLALVLDVRSPALFGKSHIPNSIFIGLDGSFAPWVGELIVNTEQPILLIAPPGRERESVLRLGRVGFDNTLGYLEGGIEAWQNSGNEVNNLPSITPNDLEIRYSNIQNSIFDVRRLPEYRLKHVKNAIFSPLSNLIQDLNKFPKNKALYLYCAGGYRSMIAASILKMEGFHKVVNIEGGFEVISQTTIPLIGGK